MKTKTIFKALALAILMPATMLTTACSSDDDSIVNNEPTTKKGYEIPVTVNVTRQSDDATTRATYNESTKKLSFSTGDKLFVKGYHSSAGSFAGTLDYVPASGTFSGIITTQNPYTADDLLSAANYKSGGGVYLLPAGYETYGYFMLLGNGYNVSLNWTYSKRFATTKALAVEQFSAEQAHSYSNGFALIPQFATFNFTITGLTPNKTVTVGLRDAYLSNVSGEVTTDESGTARFAIGGVECIEYEPEEMGLTVDGKDITIINNNTTFVAGHIYNISRSVASTPAARALSEATTDDIGKIAGADGNIYDTQAAATTAGTTAVAMIAYVGEDTYDDTYKKGLAISLADESSTMNWSTAKTTCEGKTAVTGAKWCLPSYNQWYQMLGANGGDQGKWSGLNTTITSAGGTGLQSSQGYWTSSEANSGTAYFLYIMGDGNSTATIMYDTEDNNKRVRACLVF